MACYLHVCKFAETGNADSTRPCTAHRSYRLMPARNAWALRSPAVQKPHFRGLRAAVAVSCQPFMHELQNLIASSMRSSCRQVLVDLVRCLAHGIGCSDALGHELLVPLFSGLQGLRTTLEHPVVSHGLGVVALPTLHSSLIVVLPLLKLPMAKAMLQEMGLGALLATLLHHVLALWNWVQDSGQKEQQRDCHTLCRMLVEGLRFLCDMSVRPPASFCSLFIVIPQPFWYPIAT
jgi:hypothetical protein